MSDQTPRSLIALLSSNAVEANALHDYLRALAVTLLNVSFIAYSENYRHKAGESGGNRNRASPKLHPMAIADRDTPRCDSSVEFVYVRWI